MDGRLGTSVAGASPVGRRVRRIEDAALLTGSGGYVDDIDFPGLLHASAVRSTVAHGLLRSVETSKAARMDGVVRVLTAADLKRIGVGELPVTSAVPGQLNLSNSPLAVDRVLYVGQPMAVVVATDPYRAEDAANAIRAEIEPLPVVIEPLAALDAGAELLHPDWGTNVVARVSVGTGCSDAHFECAEIVIKERFAIQRQTALPLEPRGAVARHDRRTGETVAWISTQSPHHVRTAIAGICGWPEHKLRIIAPQVGGAFGTKEYPLPEELLACVLARELGHPVKWIIDMREHLISTTHAREQVWDIELAADGQGRIRAIRGRIVYDAGAHLSSAGLGPPLQGASMFPGPYDFAELELEVIAVVTNKVPAGAYRGFGIPQAAFVMERLLDETARRLELDPAEVRRRNLIPAKSQPFVNAAGTRYDSGDYRASFERALEAIDYSGFQRKRAAARREGRCIGIGIGNFVMTTGLAPSRVLGSAGIHFGAYSTSEVRMDPSGRVTVLSGACSQGQGTATAFAQLCAAELGLDPEKDVTVILGDTAVTPYDPAGSISSRVTSIAGATVSMAAREIRDKLIRIASHMLEASVEDVELAGGTAFVKGSRSRAISVARLAEAAHLAHDLPEETPPGLDARATLDPPDSSFPFATHVATIEVDLETCGIMVTRYVVVHDSGVIVNPLLLEGQIVGGVAQGMAGAMFENLVYDLSGQPLAASLMDYLVPTAMEVPLVEMILCETPAPDIPGGVKGGAEAGAVAPAAVIANALADALADTSHAVFSLPLDPQRVFTLQRGAT
jgi:aerobic carbon-monoxide dehydrogenase large subunit